MPTASRHWSVILWCHREPSEKQTHLSVWNRQSHFERSRVSSAPLRHIFPPNQAMVITSLRAVYIHYGCPSLPPCFVPHPYTTALVYQAGEQGYGLRMGFPRSHRGQVRDWSPVLSDSDPHAIKSRSERFNWKGLCRKKKSWIPSCGLCLLFCFGGLCQLRFKHKRRFWVSFQNALEKGRPGLWY